MKRKKLIWGCVMISGLMLMGCGSAIPEMTQEENALVTGYAAQLLLEYDASSHSRLVSETEILSYKEALVEEAMQTAAATDDTQTDSEENSVAEINGDVSTTDVSAEDATTTETVTLSQALGLDDISLDYLGYEIYDYYPDSSGDEFYLTYDAGDGNQLMVLSIAATNMGSEDKNIDLFSTDTRFQIVINDEEKHMAVQSMLENDLSTLITDLSPGEEKEVNLIFEIPQELVGNIETFYLKVQYDGVIEQVSLN